MIFNKKLLTLNRFQAGGLHLLGSVIVAALATWLVFGVWYPGILADLGGVWSVFLILLGVDVTLGPLVTLIVFDTRKKELRRDLLIVVVMQLLALGYGMHTVFSGRPAYLVFNSGQFDLVYVSDIAPQSLSDAAGTTYGTLPVWGPAFVGAPMPKDPKVAAQIVADAIMGKDDIQFLPKYYQPLESVRFDLATSVLELETLSSANPDKSNDIKALIERYSEGGSSTVGYVPVKAGGETAIALIHRSTGTVVDMLRLRPGKPVK